MGLLKGLAVSILTFSFIVFVALFGRVPAFRNTPIHFLYRLIWTHIPRFLRSIDQRLTGGRLTTGAAWLGNYLMYEKHFFIVGFFFGLLAVSESLFFPPAWPHMSYGQRFMLSTLSTAPYAMLGLSVFSSPGTITSSNHEAALRLYPYDHVLYHPNKVCTTCKFVKPARSKHCRICKVCVAKSDHHCAWVNNCVGYSNYHWFLLMILSTAILVTYGTWLGYSIMSRFLQNEHQALNQHWSIGLTWPAYLQDWAWAISKELGIGAIGLLCFLCAPMLWILFGYHIYLLWAGMTTNESSKWEDWKEDMQDGLVFKARWTDVKAVATSTLGHEAEDPELDVPWPVSSDQFLVLTKDGQPPVMMSTSENAPNRPQWEKIRDLGEVNNIYDLGFWDNIMDVFMRQKL